MKYLWILTGCFIVGTPLSSFSAVVKAEKPPKVEESSRDADKASVHEASSEADQWAAKNAKKEIPPPAPEPAPAPPAQEKPKPAQAETPKPAPVEEAKPAPAETKAPPAEKPKPAVQRSRLNEMKGKLASKSYDPKTVRLSVDGGYSVEFSYDKQSAIVNGGSTVSIDDLEYGDELIVRYAGKELYALEIDRVSKAPRPQ